MKKTRKLLLTCLVIIGLAASNNGMTAQKVSAAQDITIHQSEDDMGPRH